MLIKITDGSFWNYVDKLKRRCDFYSSLYENHALEYYKVRPLDEGLSVEDRSFIICENDAPVFVFFGFVIQGKGRKVLSINDAPSSSFECENISNGTKKLIKNHFKNEIFDYVDEIRYRDYYNGKVSFISDFFMQHFSVPPQLKLSSIILLDNDYDLIRKSYRESYKNLINKCKKEVKIIVYDSKSIDERLFWNFKDDKFILWYRFGIVVIISILISDGPSLIRASTIDLALKAPGPMSGK